MEIRLWINKSRLMISFTDRHSYSHYWVFYFGINPIKTNHLEWIKRAWNLENDWIDPNSDDF